MSVLEYAAIGAAGLLGAEAAGVTDVTPIGDDGEQAPIGGGGGGGGFPGVGVGEVARIAEAVAGGGGAVPTVIDSGGETVERIRDRVPVPTGEDVIPEVPSVIDPTDPTNPGDRRGDGSSITDRQILAARSGRDPFGLQATNSGPLVTAAEVLNVGGSTAAEAGEFGTGFAEENPYFTAGTAIGAISPDPVTTAAGAAVGGSVEVGADTLTGGTPLGVQSPIDVTSGGAWWEGPDPLDLGGDGDGGDPGRSDGGTNREQDKTTDPSDRQDGDELRGTRGADPGRSDGGTNTPNVSVDPEGADQTRGDELRGTRGADSARSDGGTNREQDKNDGRDRVPTSRDPGRSDRGSNADDSGGVDLDLGFGGGSESTSDPRTAVPTGGRGYY